MLIVHYLGISQSDRVLWLCDELGLPYEMRKYDRDPGFDVPLLLARGCQCRRRLHTDHRRR